MSAAESPKPATIRCPDCGGTGEGPGDDPCASCKGRGRVKAPEGVEAPPPPVMPSRKPKEPKVEESATEPTPEASPESTPSPGLFKPEIIPAKILDVTVTPDAVVTKIQRQDTGQVLTHVQKPDRPDRRVAPPPPPPPPPTTRVHHEPPPRQRTITRPLAVEPPPPPPLTPEEEAAVAAAMGAKGSQLQRARAAITPLPVDAMAKAYLDLSAAIDNALETPEFGGISDGSMTEDMWYALRDCQRGLKFFVEGLNEARRLTRAASSKANAPSTARKEK